MRTGPDIQPPLLLIGSLPGDAARTVMAQWGGALGPRLLALPDGETGYRRMWMEFLCFQVFEPNPAIETRSRPPPVDPEDPADWRRPGDDWISLGYDRGTWRFRVRPDAKAIDLGELGYAREAVASYRAFEALRAEGRIAPALRFQVSIPLHDSSLRWYMERRRDVERLWGPYSEAVAREVEAMLAAIPAEDLLIQWDACAETLGLDPAGAGHWPWQPEGDRRERFSRSVAELSAAVPEPVMLGLHLCYGSFVEQHLVEPADLETCVALANAARARHGEKARLRAHAGAEEPRRRRVLRAPAAPRGRRHEVCTSGSCTATRWRPISPASRPRSAMRAHSGWRRSAGSAGRRRRRCRP